MVQSKQPRKNTKEDYERNNEEHQVCKIFFLRTLSYTPDKIITVTLQSCEQKTQDQRGQKAPPSKLSEGSTK